MKKIIGRKPVLEAINSNQKIDRVIISFGQQGKTMDSIRVAAKKRKIKITQLAPHKFKTYEKLGNTQGVVALITDYDFVSVDNIILHSRNSEYPLILVLDSIQDPHNVGAILRTAESVGVDGIIITERNSASINETVEKTSAGAQGTGKKQPICCFV